MLPTFLFSELSLFSIPLQKLYISEYDIIEDHHRENAIDTFGSKLANSLREKDGSWKSVIISRNLFLTIYEIIQQYSTEFHSLPKDVEFVTQSSHGIILDYQPVPDCGLYAHLPPDGFLGHLITPYGTLEIVFRNDPKKFLNSITKFFVNQLRVHYPRYSLTLNAQTTATIKNPSRVHYELKFEDQIPKEMLPCEYSRTDIDQICTALNDKYSYLEITPKKYLLRGLCGEWI